MEPENQVPIILAGGSRPALRNKVLNDPRLMNGLKAHRIFAKALLEAEPWQMPGELPLARVQLDRHPGLRRRLGRDRNARNRRSLTPRRSCRTSLTSQPLIDAVRTAPAQAHRRGLSPRAREEIAGWLWTSPWLIGFFLFFFGPMVASLYLSFTKYAIGGTPQVIGLDNFVRALSGKDDLFWPSMGRTVEYAFVMVPIGIGLSLLAATLLNQGLKGTAALPHAVLPALVDADCRRGGDLALAVSA